MQRQKLMHSADRNSWIRLLLWGILLFLCLSSLGRGQGASYPGTPIALTRGGLPAAGATVTVCTGSVATNVLASPPCSPYASIYSDAALTVPIAQPGFKTDGLGNYPFSVATGTYTVCLTGSSFVGACAVWNAPLQNGGISVLQSLNSIRFCDQYGGLTAAAIQACITDTPDGGTAYLPRGTWSLTANLPITITKSIRLSGAGWGTVLSVGAAVGATTDIFVIQPPLNTVLHGGKIENFAIIPVSGKPARHAFHLDGTNGEILNWVWDHIRVEQLGGNAVYAEGPGYDTLHSAQGTPALTNFQNSVWRGGFTFTNSGDTNKIIGGQITGDGKAIEYSAIAGATDFIVLGTNITSDGGSHFGTNVSSPHFIAVEAETFTSFTGSNGRVFDFDGTTGSHVVGPEFTGGHISVVNGITADGIGLNYANGAIISGVTFALGSGASHDITETANSATNMVGLNNFGTSVATSMVNDSGAGNLLWTFVNNGKMLIGNNRPIAGVDDGGNFQNMLLMETSGSVLYYGYHGQKALEGVSGATYLYDGSASNRIGAAVGIANSSTPDSATIFSAYKFYAQNLGRFDGGVQPSSTGTAITWFQKATDATVDLASIANGACSTARTVTVTGALLGDSCTVSAGSALEDGLVPRCAVTAADTTKWQYCNNSGGAIDRASDTYTIRDTR